VDIQIMPSVSDISGPNWFQNAIPSPVVLHSNANSRRFFNIVPNMLASNN